MMLFIGEYKKNKGFTLIELMVVMSVFLFVIGAAIVIFISIIQNQKKILAEQELLNQISYVEEYMSKALRMAKTAVTESDIACLDGNQGYIYLLSDPDENGFYRSVKFINQSDGDACQEFFLDSVTDPAHPVLKELKNSTNKSNAVAITSEKLQIDFVRFGINGTDGSNTHSPNTSGDFAGAKADDPVQPRITILLGIKIQGDSQEGAPRIIQTTVSQRNFNAR